MTRTTVGHRALARALTCYLATYVAVPGLLQRQWAKQQALLSRSVVTLGRQVPP